MKRTRVRVCLLLFTLLSITLANSIVQSLSVKTAKLGDSVTFSCFFKDNDVTKVYWIRQQVGQKPSVVVKTDRYFNDMEILEGFKEINRFHAHGEKGSFNITINNTELLDSALYYCGIMKWTELSFGDVTFLTVTGENSPHSVRVTQQPAASVPAQPGDSVTLQCTVDSGSCAGEHSVYWFTLASGESQPGVIYSHGGRSAECEKSPEAGSVPQSCVYSLPVNHADTYYCAVAACGHMVLGNGTTVEDGGGGTKPPAGNGHNGFSWTTLGLVPAFVLSVMINIALFYIIMKMRSANGTRDGQQRVTEVDSHQQDPHSEDLLHYAAINLKKPKPQRKKREPKEDTVYSDLRYQH